MSKHFGGVVLKLHFQKRLEWPKNQASFSLYQFELLQVYQTYKKVGIKLPKQRDP